MINYKKNLYTPNNNAEENRTNEIFSSLKLTIPPPLSPPSLPPLPPPSLNSLPKVPPPPPSLPKVPPPP